MSEKVFSFHLHIDRGCQTNWGNGQRSQVSVIFILLLTQKKDEDRQWQTDGKKLPAQKADKTSQIKMTTWKRKQNTSHSNFERYELRKGDGDGMARGRGREKKKRARDY